MVGLGAREPVQGCKAGSTWWSTLVGGRGLVLRMSDQFGRMQKLVSGGAVQERLLLQAALQCFTLRRK